MEISGDTAQQYNQPRFYLVFPSASSELFSRLYLTGFDCVRLTYVLSVHPDILNPSKLYLLPSLPCFRCFQFSIEVTKYLSKIKINSKQHQLTLTKAVKASKTMDLFSTRLLFFCITRRERIVSLNWLYYKFSNEIRID